MFIKTEDIENLDIGQSVSLTDFPNTIIKNIRIFRISKSLLSITMYSQPMPADICSGLVTWHIFNMCLKGVKCDRIDDNPGELDSLRHIFWSLSVNTFNMDIETVVNNINKMILVITQNIRGYSTQGGCNILQGLPVNSSYKKEQPLTKREMFTDSYFDVYMALCVGYRDHQYNNPILVEEVTLGICHGCVLTYNSQWDSDTPASISLTLNLTNIKDVPSLLETLTTEFGCEIVKEGFTTFTKVKVHQSNEDYDLGHNKAIGVINYLIENARDLLVDDVVTFRNQEDYLDLVNKASSLGLTVVNTNKNKTVPTFIRTVDLP